MHIVKRTFLFTGLLLLLFSWRGEAQTTSEKKLLDLTKYTVFSTGDDNVNSYRMPSLLTAKDGSLLVFCEDRRESWRDKVGQI